MKKLLTVLFAIGSIIVYGQNSDTTYWKYGGAGSLTFSQVSLTNWASGGENSTAINASFGIFANRTKARGKWESTLDLAYGIVKQGNNDLVKSDDQINVSTKYGYRIKKENAKWFFSGLVDFKTQFNEGFATPLQVNLISDFMAPGYLVIGAGGDYYPNDKFTFSYIPLTGKFTFVNVQSLADKGAYGVEGAVYADDGVTVITPGKNTRAEVGSFFRAKYKNDIFESRLELFTSYIDSFGTIDVNWQNALVMNVTKWLTMNISTQLIYDKDILIEDENGVEDDRVQFKSVIGAGITYKFGAQKGK